MKWIETSLLVIHIIAGFSALAVGTSILIVKKGNELHRKLGLLFFYAMATVGISAVIMSTYRDSLFLFCIGIFSLFQIHFGKQSIQNKSLKPTFFDHIVTLIGIANGIVMVMQGNVVLLVFGIIQLQLCFTVVWTAIKLARKEKIHPKAWLRQHIGMMMGSYIATFTAFMVVNLNDVQPQWIVWLGPTALLVPLMQFWTYKFTSEKKNKSLAKQE